MSFEKPNNVGPEKTNRIISFAEAGRIAKEKEKSEKIRRLQKEEKGLKKLLNEDLDMKRRSEKMSLAERYDLIKELKDVQKELEEILEHTNKELEEILERPTWGF